MYIAIKIGNWCGYMCAGYVDDIQTMADRWRFLSAML